MKLPFNWVKKSAVSDNNGRQFPNSYDNTNMRDRRFQWSNRIITIILCSSMFINIGLFFTVMALFPLKTETPIPVEIANGSNVLARIQPLRTDMGGFDQLAQYLCMQYVVYRNEIVRSNQVMSRRWLKDGYVDAMSGKAEYNRFYSSNAAGLKEIREQDSTQQPQIDGSPIVLQPWSRQHNGAYQVNFELIGRNPQGAEFSRRYFVATMEITFVPLTGLSNTEREENPSGFKVINYTVAERSAPQGASPTQ